ncbi:exopolysaccharide transport family protein [Rhodoligotrophos appendicifer]|uniref:GumC family protein n=1 Tax=Rhodoligotrophos appendicifer TaxID=987056 RepID=UPI0014785A32|nr:polysaccharide biosynthesis tyrosine autokinase [Rhodoligotrophos appendicifer]
MKNETVAAVEDAEIDLREIMRALRRRWQLIAGTIAVGLALVSLYLMVATPLYTASASILIDTRSKAVFDAEAVLSGMGADTAAIDSQVELIKSTATALRVADKLKLANDVEFRPTSDGFSPVGWLMSMFQSEAKSDATPLPVDDTLTPEQASLAQAVLTGLDVRREGRTYVLVINYTAKSPDKAARIANAFAGEYLVDQLEAKFEATKLATDWLNERLSALAQNLRVSENAVEQFKQENNIISTGGQDIFEQQLGQINQQLVLASADVAEAKARYDRVLEIQSQPNSQRSLEAVIRSDVVAQLRGQQSTIAGREAELATRYGSKHPQVINIRAQRGDIERQITLEVSRVVANIKNDYEVALTRAESLQESLEKLQSGIEGNKSATIRVRELEREASANRALYEAFLGRFKEVSQQETLQTPEARIIAKAFAPTSASYPNKKLALAIAFVGFCGIGVGLAFLTEHLDDSFKSSAQVEEVLKLPVLATVPLMLASQLKSDKGVIPAEKFAVNKPLSTYAEAIRALKMEILLSNIDQPPRVVMVTSAVPAEGKTTLSSNLASFAAHTGMKVLLMDADLRHPALTNRWLGEGADSAPGLVEFLVGQVSAESVLLKDPETHLHFLPASQRVQNTAEVLESAKMRDWLRRARDLYDLVIVDSSPITPVVDSRVLAKEVDSILLVVEWDKTPREVVMSAMRNLGPNAHRIAGVALNKVNVKKMSGYSPYGYGYAYGKYPHYYGKDD